MKKQILLFLAAFISTLAMAQSKFSFGIKGGVTSAGIKGEAIDGLKNLLDYTDGRITTRNTTGLFAGGSVSIPLSDFISVEPGIQYSQKGYQLRGNLGIKALDFLGVNAKANLNTQYVEMPVVLKANFGGLQLFTGPQLSYLAQADLRVSAGALGFNVYDTKVDATAQLNRWDAGITGGIGYQLKNGLNIHASYDHGLMKMDADKRLDAYNRAFKVGLGFNF